MINVLYRPNSDHQRAVLDYRRDFKRFTGKDLNLISLDTREGADTARLYDITRYPAIVVITQEGKLLKNWQGLPLPVMNEVSYYASDYYN